MPETRKVKEKLRNIFVEKMDVISCEKRG